MVTTTYGYLNPSSGDLSKGTNGWMAAINFDFSRWDGHSHNGVDSALLNIGAIAAQTVVAPSGSWTVNSGGTGLPSSGYVQTVTVPAAIGEINNFSVKFIINTSGSTQYQPLDLFYARLTGTTFNLYSNSNSIDVLCVFR
jgi:hypothetical protein